jgi:plastocyanin
MMKRAWSMSVASALAALAVAAAAPGYEAMEVTGGGSVSGQVKYAGTPPARAKIDVTKDVNVCAKENKLSEELIVGTGGGIANVVVRLANITKGAALKPASPNPTFDQKVCQFRPHVLVFPAGSTVDVLNSDGILHNVHTYSQTNPPSNQAQPGFKKQIQIKFEKPEFPIKIQCDAHPWMSGWFVVQEHPYYAVTDESGAFKIANVPAGDYDLEAWQEKLGKQTAKVSVKPGADTAVTITYAAK